MTAPETVILVHGLWMHGAAMLLMRRRIARCGYRAVSYSYPSMRLTLTENAERLAQFCRNTEARRIHFVAHSLGALVVLCMIKSALVLRVGRIVLVGPPCAGSHAAQRMARMPGGRAALGRSIADWRPDVRSERIARHEIGVIAGSVPFGLGRIVAPDLPRPNDGVVSVEETRLAGMREHIVLEVNHAGMLVSGAVAREACEFLRHGRFLGKGVTGTPQGGIKRNDQ